jgi:N-acetylmuramoyl-L-alanine amidase
MPLPLEAGARGEDVRDLHLRLAAAGFAVRGAAPDHFSEATSGAVRSFQAARGLAASGVCDSTTWHQLVEAGHRLGDRLLYLHAPKLRGDDVAELQLRLGSLGFDAGRVDGIFGSETERALVDFQRNAGLPTDGIAGQDTVRELGRLGAKSDQRDPVAVVRERERLRRSPRSLVDRRVVLGEFGGSAAAVLATARQLRTLGASVITLHHPDASRQANDANASDAELYLAVDTTADAACCAMYFATTGFVSTGGLRLAQIVAAAAAEVLQTAPTSLGNRTPVLRETRMPAVQLRVGPAGLVGTHLATLAAALVAAIEHWFLEPIDDVHPEQEGSSRP